MTPWEDSEVAFEPLRELLTHEEDITRGMAAMALASLNDDGAFEAMVKMLQQDSGAYARRCAACALGELALPKARPELEQAAQAGDAMVAADARNALERLVFLASNAKLDGPAAQARQGLCLISGSTMDQETRLQRAMELIRQCPPEQRQELLKRWSKNDSPAIRNSVPLTRQRLEEQGDL